MAKFSPAISSLKICDVDKMFFSECTSDPSISEIRNKDYFFPKKNIHHRNTKSEKRRLCNLGEICTFQRQKSTYFGCCFFKRIISVNLEENLKNKISDFRLSNIIHFCYCILFFHFLDQYVCMDVNFVWIISSFL